MPKPSIGRIVHYVSYGTPGGEFTSQCRAAIITEVDDPPPVNLGGQRVGLAVLNPTGIFLHSLAAGGCVHREDNKAGGSWHWPERMEE